MEQVEKWLRRAEDQSLKLSLVSFPDAKCWTRNKTTIFFETKRKAWRDAVFEIKTLLKKHGGREMWLMDPGVIDPCWYWTMNGAKVMDVWWYPGGNLPLVLKTLFFVVLEDGLIKFEYRLWIQLFAKWLTRLALLWFYYGSGLAPAIGILKLFHCIHIYIYTARILMFRMTLESSCFSIFCLCWGEFSKMERWHPGSGCLCQSLIGTAGDTDAAARTPCPAATKLHDVQRGGHRRETVVNCDRLPKVFCFIDVMNHLQ